MVINKYFVNLCGENIVFFAPEGDSVVPGTIAGLKKDNWGLDRIKFDDGDIFVDIGCSIGLLSLIVAIRNPKVIVYSFDANPIAVECLKASIDENKIKNIVPFNLAIGVENKRKVEFLTYTENESCLIQKDLCTNRRDVSFFCDMISIDNVFDSIIGKRDVKYFKMDIETGEFDVCDHLFSKRPDILNKIEYSNVEIHPYDDSFPKSKKLRLMLEEKFKDKCFH